MSHPHGIPLVYSPNDLADHGGIFRRLKQEGKACPARLSVFGDPVSHSASPPMHNAALRAGGHELQYVRIRVTPGELAQALGNLGEAGFLGTNLTIPHKQSALNFIDEISPEARLMGAINTVAVRDGRLHGFNTDGPGFAAAVREEFGTELGEHRVLVLGGGGGAGRAISVQCALSRCPEIFVANRTLEKAELLSQEIEESLGVNSTPIILTPEALKNAVACTDLIVNATPLGMTENDPSPLPKGLLTRHHFVYDTVYGTGTSALIRQSEAAGVKSANGLSMLLHQGALAYEIWFNEAAPLEIMREALRKSRLPEN